ncbi:MAG: sulfotransferase domain-containing protein [Erysipelotrichaceae bacterium]
MNKIIAPISYMGSGSSAITGILSEFSCNDTRSSDFEFVFLHCPNGVFDLEDKLLRYNNSLRSDEALHSFYQTMKDLFDKKYYWVGHYNEVVSPDFMTYVNDFISKIIQFKPEFYWYYQENADYKMIVKLIVRKLVYYGTFKRIQLKKPLLYPEMWISFVDEKTFYDEANMFIKKVFDALGYQDKNIVLDQLLLPYNLNRVDHYFGDELRGIVVERDPRDVFISNKYFWKPNHEPIPYPTDVNVFCDYYRKMRRQEKPIETNKVLRIHFEDLIYNYDQSIQMICDFCEFSIDNQVNKRKSFNPDVSINNTQLFRLNKEFEKEADIIKEKLAEYIYDFPYEYIPSSKLTF